MAENDYPAPATPRGLKEMVALIKSDKGYADFIHEKVKEARNGDAAAKAVVKAHFFPQTEELTDLQLSTEQATALQRCTDPRTHLVDFAYYVAYPPT
jgi:hypothetical protein